MSAIPQLDAGELARLLSAPSAERPFLLDVREPHEHALARLPEAVLVPLHELPERLDELPADREVVVYCHHGMRSLSGAALLIGAGRRARSLRGGIDAWSLLIDPRVPRY